MMLEGHGGGSHPSYVVASDVALLATSCPSDIMLWTERGRLAYSCSC